MGHCFAGTGKACYGTVVGQGATRTGIAGDGLGQVGCARCAVVHQRAANGCGITLDYAVVAQVAGDRQGNIGMAQCAYAAAVV